MVVRDQCCVGMGKSMKSGDITLCMCVGCGEGLKKR